MPLTFNGSIQTIKKFDNPNDISGILLWLDAADTSTITKDVNNNVTQWRDKSMNATHFINGSTNYPKSGTKTYNGLNVIDLQTTASSYLISSSNIIVNTSYSMFIVCYSSSVGTASYMRPANLTSGINTDGIWTISQNSNTKMYCLIGPQNGTWNNTTTYNANLQNMNIISFVTNCTKDISNVGVTLLYVNGLLTATQSTPQLAKPYTVTSNTPIWIGAVGPSGTSQYIAGTVAEAIIYNNVAFSPFYRQKIEGYLANKWGIQMYLPSTHPMTSIPSFDSKQSFTPKNINGLWLWLDASDKSTIASTTNNVTQWNDKSGNGYNFINGDTNYMTTNTSYIGIYNALDPGTAGSKYLKNANITLPTNVTIFCAVGKSSSTNYNYCFSSLATVNNNFMLIGSFQNQFQDSPKYNNVFFGVSNSSGGNTTINHINTVSCSGSTSGSILSIYQTGNLIKSQVLTQTPSHQLGINIGNGAAGYHYAGLIGEILVFSPSLSDSNRQKIEGYLAWKWEMNQYLPTNHPYYSYFPFNI